MIRFELLSGLVVLALWVYCLTEVVGSSESEIRNLPKLWWLLIVLLFPFAGSVAWLVAGRPQGAVGRSKHERAVPGAPEYDRPRRAATTEPEGEEEFLRKVRERAEEQRRAYRATQMERQREDQERQRELKRKEAEGTDPGP